MPQLEKTKYPCFSFSKTFQALYQQLKHDLIYEGLIATPAGSLEQVEGRGDGAI